MEMPFFTILFAKIWQEIEMFDKRLYWQMYGEIGSIYGWKDNKLL